MKHPKSETEERHYVSRSRLLVWFVCQWPILAVELLARLAWNLVLLLGDGTDAVPVSDVMCRYLGPSRLVREWTRDFERWSSHYRKILVKLRPGSDYNLRLRLKYHPHWWESDGKRWIPCFTIPVQDYRGCGLAGAQRMAKEQGWTVFHDKPGVHGIRIGWPAPDERSPLSNSEKFGKPK